MNALQMNHKFEVGKLVEWNKEEELIFFEMLERIKSDEIMPTCRNMAIKSNIELQIPENVLTSMLTIASIPKGPDGIDISKADKETLDKDFIRLLGDQINTISHDEHLWLY